MIPEDKPPTPLNVGESTPYNQLSMPKKPDFPLKYGVLAV